MRKVVIRELDGFVENIIEIEEGAGWSPPEGCHLVDSADGSPGDTWDGKKFVKPELPAPTPEELAEAEDIRRASELLANSPDVITQPEIWELLRIFGRRLGYNW